MTNKWNFTIISKQTYCKQFSLFIITIIYLVPCSLLVAVLAALAFRLFVSWLIYVAWCTLNTTYIQTYVRTYVRKCTYAVKEWIHLHRFARSESFVWIPVCNGLCFCLYLPLTLAIDTIMLIARWTWLHSRYRSWFISRAIEREFILFKSTVLIDMHRKSPTAINKNIIEKYCASVINLLYWSKVVVSVCIWADYSHQRFII